MIFLRGVQSLLRFVKIYALLEDFLLFLFLLFWFFCLFHHDTQAITFEFENVINLWLIIFKNTDYFLDFLFLFFEITVSKWNLSLNDSHTLSKYFWMLIWNFLQILIIWLLFWLRLRENIWDKLLIFDYLSFVFIYVWCFVLFFRKIRIFEDDLFGSLSLLRKLLF